MPVIPMRTEREPISMTVLPIERTSTAMVLGDNSKNDKDQTSPGVLDDFLNANGPSSVTIETAFPSPDKTTSEMVSLARLSFQLNL